MALQHIKPLPIALATLFALTVLGGMTPRVEAQTTQAAMSFDVSSRPLGDALNELARQARLQLMVNPALVAGKQAPALSGNWTVPQALQHVLANSGLVANIRGNEVVVVRTTDDTSQESTLPVVNVMAPVGGASEGTGSYTAKTSAAATGLTLSVRDTPQSVSVLTKQQIDDQNLITMGEAIKNVTGMNVSSSDSERTDIWSRGFYVDNYQHDGVPSTITNDFFGSSMLDFVIYDRIEVVRGATGLMTGAGSPGASVNLIRKRASSKVFTGEATLGLGSWDHRRGTLDVSMPLSADGSVRARVAGMVDAHDSQLDRYHTDSDAFLATVEADLTPSTTLRIGVERQSKRPTGVTWGGVPMISSEGLPLDWSSNFSIGADWTNWKTTNTTTYAGLEHTFDNRWKIKATVSRLESDYDAKLLYLLGKPSATTGLGTSAYPHNSSHQLTQEDASVQATGPFTLFGQEHEAVIGVSGSKTDYISGNSPTLSSAPIGNLYDWNGKYPEPVWDTYRQVGHDRTTQNALYGALRLSVTDKLRLILGARYDQWKRETLTAERKHNVITPYAGLIYDFTPTYSGYVSYTDIFQPQDNKDVKDAYLDPIRGKSYEAGIKGEYLEGRVNASLGIFHIVQDNVAVEDGNNRVPSTGGQAYIGAKGVTSRGYEAQVSGKPTTNWDISTGFARTMAKKTDGTRLSPQKPQNLFHLFTSYRVAATDNKLVIGGGLQWRSSISMPYTVSGIQTKRDQGSFSVFNMMANYAFTPKLSAQLNITNLFDKHYFDLASDGLGYYGATRKAMLTMKYQF